MGTCKNCKYWGTYSRSCDRAEWLDVNSCYTDVELKDKDFGFIAYADDDSNLNAAVCTGPDFGCILFEKKGD